MGGGGPCGHLCLAASNCVIFGAKIADARKGLEPKAKTLRAEHNVHMSRLEGEFRSR